MPNTSKKVRGKSINDKLGKNVKSDTSQHILTNNDRNEDPRSELDTLNISSKIKKSGKSHPKPQADETMNPGLNSENDI